MKQKLRKKQIGRPRLESKEKRSVRIPIMVTLEESERIEQAAKQAGKPVSSFCRDAILQAIKEPS
jgi:uncharacterized protein (DUF1778 family)